MKRYLLGILMCATLLALLVACGGGGGGQPDPTPGETAPVAAPTPPPVAAVAPDAEAIAAVVGTPTPGRLLAHDDGTLFSRADILATAATQPAPAGQLILGTSTPFTGNWISGWDTTATPMWFRELLHGGREGYSTMVMTYYGQFVQNPLVVQSIVPTTHPDGSRTYLFTIYTENRWSDGTPITAIDYVFGIMIYSSYELDAIGASAMTGEWLVGFSEFSGGETSTFAGLRLLSDDSFSVTVRPEALPFVWEFFYQWWNPTPFHYWSNNGTAFTVTDTGNGATFNGLTVDFLQDRVNSPNGIRFNPTVVSGPYMLESWDEGSGTVVLVRNPYFVSTWDGFNPQIYRVAGTTLANAVQVDALRLGEVDMLHGLRSGLLIQSGHDLVNELGIHDFISFARNGYGHLTFHGDHGPTQFAGVRRSIAWLLDRDDFARQFTGGWGFVIQGPYVENSWEFAGAGHRLYGHPDFTFYDFNPTMAIAELEGAGFDLNADGNPFVLGTDPVRYRRMEDGSLMRLQLNWAANDNAVSDIMRVMLLPVAEEIGMIIIEDLYPAGTSNIPAFGRQPGTEYSPGGGRFQYHHMFTLAVGMGVPNMPWYSWSIYEEHQVPGRSTSWHMDQELHDLVWAMRNLDTTVAGWEEEYFDRWVAFQLRWNYVLPQLPLYADEDHDFYANWIGDWDAHSIWDFRHAVTRAYDGRTR